MSSMGAHLSPVVFRGAAVVMGVTGSGKTTVGRALAARLDVWFLEGDLLHPAANITKMSAGIPLTDDDRWPWLVEIGQRLRGTSGVIASCSALKRAYRQKLAAAANRPVSFIFLDGARSVLEYRVSNRPGHFMPASLLDSQLATLEKPGLIENAITVNIALSVEQIVARAVAFLTGVEQEATQ
jgi:gluconokinase